MYFLYMLNTKLNVNIQSANKMRTFKHKLIPSPMEWNELLVSYIFNLSHFTWYGFRAEPSTSIYSKLMLQWSYSLRLELLVYQGWQTESCLVLSWMEWPSLRLAELYLLTCLTCPSDLPYQLEKSSAYGVLLPRWSSTP